jgi:rhamnosyltransferase
LERAVNPVASASVIIRTKNEAKWLDRTLRGVLRQDPQPLEVIVIDSGSIDETVAIARRHPVVVLTIDPAEWGYSRAINRAAEVASGDVLVMLSAHCPPVTRHWLSELLAPFADPDVAGTWGPNLRPGRPVPVPGPPMRQEPGSYGPHNRTWGLSNANAAVRRALWKEFPFDERLPAAEDKGWGMEAMSRGYALVHVPAAAVWHPAHPLMSAFRRNRAVEQGFAMLFPGDDVGAPHPVRVVVGAARRSLAFHTTNRDLKAVARDVMRAPSTLFAIIGAAWGRRRRAH